MAKSTRTPDEEATRSFSSMMRMTQALPHLIELARTMSDVLDEAQAAKTKGSGRQARAEPLSMVVRANSLLFANSMRFWLRWQELMAKHVPAITRSMEQFRAAQKKGSQASQSPEARAVLVDSIRAYVREMAELPCDQCKQLRQDLERMESEIFGTAKDAEPRRRWKAKA